MLRHIFVCALLCLAVACQPFESPFEPGEADASGQLVPGDVSLTASVQLTASFAASSTARITVDDVARVEVQITWTGGQTPVLEMQRTPTGAFEIVIGDLPANLPCTASAKAFGSEGQVLYEGQAGELVFAPDVQTSILVNMVAADNGVHVGFGPRIVGIRRPASPIQTGNIIDVEVTVADPDDTELLYTFESPAGGSFNQPTGRIMLTEGTGVIRVQYTVPEFAGPAPVAFQVVDAAGLAAKYNTTFVIQDEPIDPNPTQAGAAINFPPVIEGITANRLWNRELHLAAVAADDGPTDALTYRWTREGTLIGESNPVPVVAEAGIYTVTLKVTDGLGASTSLSYELNTAGTEVWITPLGNEPPEVVTAVQSRDDVSYGDVVELAVYAADPAGEPLTAEWSTDKGTLDAMSSEVERENTIFRAKWHADVTAGTAQVTVKISDPRQAWVAYLFPIHQVLGRVGIVANAGPDQEALLGGVAWLDGSGSTSEDGVVTSYEWAKISGPETVIKSTGSAMTEVSFTTIGTYRYRLTVKNVNNVATDEVQVVVTNPRAFMFEAAEMTSDGMVYFLNRVDRKVHRYDIATETFLPPWATRTDVKTMAVAPEGNAVYVGYLGGAIDVFETATGERSYFASSSDTAYSMAVVGKYLFLIDRVGGSATYCTYDRATGVRAATTSPGYYYYSAYLGVARSLNRVFHFRDSTSPNDIHRVDVNPATGQLSNISESPYHGSYSFTPPIRLFPGDTKVAVASGAIFSTGDLTTAGSFGRSYVDMGFYGQYAHLISKNGTRTEVNVYDTNLAVQAVKYFDGDPLRLFIHEDKFVLITKQAERMMSVQVAGLPLE